VRLKLNSMGKWLRKWICIHRRCTIAKTKIWYIQKI